jgi:hypothetical protein
MSSVKRTVFALILIVGGVTTASLAADRTAQGPEYVQRWGWSLHGEVVAAERTGVVVSCSLLGEERLGVARPHDPSAYAVGDTIWVSLLDGAKDRVVIWDGDEVAPMGVMLWGALASLAVLLGVGMILMRFVSTPVAGHYSLPNWRNERHGGA